MTILSTNGAPSQSIPEPEAKIIEAMMDGADPVVAVKGAGYNLNDRNAKVLAEHLWKKHVSANETVLAALHRHDITPDRIARKMSHLLDAQTVFRTKDGVMYHEDNVTQLKTVEMVHKLAGSFAPKASISANISFEGLLDEIEEEA